MVVVTDAHAAHRLALDPQFNAVVADECMPVRGTSILRDVAQPSAAACEWPLLGGCCPLPIALTGTVTYCSVWAERMVRGVVIRSAPQRLRLAPGGNRTHLVLSSLDMGSIGVRIDAESIDDMTPGSPAHTAGLEVGDRIVSVDGEPWVPNYAVPLSEISAAMGDRVSVEVEDAYGNRYVVATWAAAQPRLVPDDFFSERKPEDEGTPELIGFIGTEVDTGLSTTDDARL